MTAPALDAPLTLTVEETARLIDMGTRQAYEAVRRGDIPAVRIGSRWYVKRAELLRMFGLDESSVRPQRAREPQEPRDSAADREGT